MHKRPWSNVALILQREVRDQLRDRRTLFMIFVLPLLLYPMMGMSFLQMAQFLKKNASRVLVVSEEELPKDPPLFGPPWFGAEADSGGNAGEEALIDVEYRLEPLPNLPKAKAQAGALIDSGHFDVIVCVPQIVREPSGRTPHVLLFMNSSKDRSRVAYERVAAAWEKWRLRTLDHKLAALDLSLEKINPIQPQTHDLAAPVGRGAAIWSKILPFVAVVWALTGAFYPAVDLCAGEKERGTLETLLCSPALRSEIVWGKLLTIMLFSLTTALLNLFCMTFTATFIMRQFQTLSFSAGLPSLPAPPLASLAWLILALLPLVALFSALSLALAAMARSTKEGQYYLMPLLLISLPLMMLAMLPSAKLDLGTSIVPISGVLLLIRQLMEGEYHTALLFAAPVILVTAGCCWMSIRWAIDQFDNEGVLFRASERFSVGLWFRQLVRDRSATPSVAEGVMCGVVILMIRFFAGLSLPFPATWEQFALLTVLTLVAFVASPALLMAIMLTVRPWATLLITRPRGGAILAGALFALCFHPVSTAIAVMLRALYPIDNGAFAQLDVIFAQAPNLFSMVMLLAFLPALCEELAFRGFILSGLRHMGSKWRAIFVSSLFFALAHGMIHQSLGALLSGLILGFMAIQSGSIWPCVTFHALHNALAIGASRWLPAWDQAAGVTSNWVTAYPELQGANATVYLYHPQITCGAFLLCIILFRWFQQLDYQRSDEERLSDALGHQSVPAGY